MITTTPLPRLLAVSVLNAGAPVAEWLGVLDDGRIMYARRRHGAWQVNAGSSADDAMMPGARSAQMLADAGLGNQGEMRFDGAVLAHGEAADQDDARAELARIATGVLELSGCRWVSAPYDGDLSEIACLLRAAALPRCR